MTLGTAYQAAATHDDVLSVSIKLLDRRVWFARLCIVAVCVAKRVGGKWVGWIGESSATLGAVGPLYAFGDPQARAKLAAELGVS